MKYKTLSLHSLWFVPLFFAMLFAQTSCSSTKSLRRSIEKHLETSEIFSQQFTGIVLYNPATDKTLFSHNGDKYFTPASNTKLFTFYAGLKILGDSVPALEYILLNDSLLFRGTGDPSFLNADLMDSSAYTFLCNRKEALFYVLPAYREKYFGPGWAWDDYNDYYSVERSAFPIYGNYAVFSFDKHHPKTPEVSPSYFMSSVLASSDTAASYSLVRRDISENTFRYKTYYDTAEYAQIVPFKYSPELFTRLLSDTLNKKVKLLESTSWPKGASKYFYSLPADSLYKRMLQVSDNFIAEQILLLCSSTLSDSLKTSIAIDYTVENFLDDLPDKPVWIDGSGLSRYNLFTPRSIVKLLAKINKEVDEERLFELLPAGGQSGTIKNYYGGDPAFVFAKTGTLSNNHCLSGFIITQSGKKLIFSIMNNHYITPTDQIRKGMETILKKIHYEY